MSDKIGIVGYGVYIPEWRLSLEEIWDTWVYLDPSTIKNLLGISRVAFNSWYEDVITMASDSAKAGLEMANVDPRDIGAFFLGTCTNPYVTKASVTFLIESLGLPTEVFSADCQFGSKSGTTVLQICASLVGSHTVEYGLAIGSDSLTSHVAPNEWPLEYTASAGAAAYVVGRKGVIAEIEHMYSTATETTDYYRLDGDRYIKSAVSTDEAGVGYEEHTVAALNGFLKKFGYSNQDFSYVALHQPNGVGPFSVARNTGFAREQLIDSMIADKVGDLGSACSLSSLAKVLDKAKPEEKILVASYGQGAGCDVLSLNVTGLIEEAKGRRKVYLPVSEQIERETTVGYKEYIRMQRKLIQEYV